MNLLQRLKAVFDSSKVQAASGRSMIVGGDAMRAPFDLRAGVKAYNSWIYAAANLNAVAVASTPLRLYIRKRSNRTKLWNTKEVSRATKAYLSGRARQMPSHCVMRKSASIGENYEEVVDSHPLLELLANVNPYQNGFDASVLRTLFGELTGNAFIHPVMDKRLKIPEIGRASCRERV
jgi:phage portal protein BeeE